MNLLRDLLTRDDLPEDIRQAISEHLAATETPWGDRVDVSDPVCLSILRSAALHRVMDTLEYQVFVKDSSSRFIMANEAVRRAIGSGPPDILGKTDRDLLPPEYAEQHIDEERAILSREVPQIVLSWPIPPDDVGPRWLTGTKAPLRNDAGAIVGLVGVNIDITEQHRAQQATAERELRYRTLVENIPYIVSRLDREGRHLFLSPGTVGNMGLRDESIIGRTHRELGLPETLCDDIEDAIRRVFETGEGLEVALNYEAPEGAVFFHWRLAPERDESGQVVSALGIGRDITVERQAERERRRLDERLQQAQKLESLSVLAGGVAHDFNNILMGVMGNAELARAQLAPDTRAHALIGSIQVGAERAADLSRQMLAYSGGGAILPRAVNITRLVEESTDLYRSWLSSRVELQMELADDLPPALADRVQISQVVMNLVKNASEAIGSSQGLVRVQTSLTPVDASYLAHGLIPNLAAKTGEYVCIQVTDTGCGIEDATLPRIFEPFYSTKFPGRGLGLGATLGIVRSHGGLIRVQTTVGQGSSFEVLLPLADEQDATAAEPAPMSARHSPLPLAKPGGTILVADDEPMVLAVCEAALSQAGFEVVCASDGAQAIREYEQRAGEIRAVLVDLTMPIAGGHEVYVAIRPRSPWLPIVLSSGFSEQEAVGAVLHLDFAGFLQKPYSPRDLVALMTQVIREAEKA